MTRILPERTERGLGHRKIWGVFVLWAEFGRDWRTSPELASPNICSFSSQKSVVGSEPTAPTTKTN